MSFFGRLFGRGGGGGGAAVPPEYALLLEQSMEELRLKTAAHDQTWGFGEADWSVDQEAGTIVFTSPRGLVATAPVQIIGTLNAQDGTFLWGWEHPSVQPPLQTSARVVRAYGEQHGVARLTTRKIPCTEMQAWEFAALAAKLTNAQGAYRGPAGSTYVFMTFGDVQLRAQAAS